MERSRHDGDPRPGAAGCRCWSGGGWQAADPELPERGRRRAFASSYKLEILAAYDAAEPGEKGALLRREGPYSSHIMESRRARDAGALAGLAQTRDASARIRGTRRSPGLEREKQRLEQVLAKARFVVDVQAKQQVEALRERGHRAEVNAMTDEAVAELVPVTGTWTACATAVG